MTYPDSLEQKIGFDKIRIQVKSRCITQAAKHKAESAPFLRDIAEISKQLSRVAEMKTIHMIETSFPDGGYVDIDRFAFKIRTAGNYLDPHELLDLKTALVTVSNIASFLARKENYPALKAMMSPLAPMPDIVVEIDRIIDRFGAVRDSASPQLAEIRRETALKRTAANRRIQSLLKAAQIEGTVDPDASVTLRDGRTLIPVPAANKRKIRGAVVGESATGKTVFIEPLEIVEINNLIRELEFAEQREIIKILVAVTDILRPRHDEILVAGDLLTEIDFITAKARHAVEIEAVMPLLCDEPRIGLLRARHPLLMQVAAKEKKEVVPLDLSLTRDKRILLVSGPNAGGKSVCIKTVGLLQYMLQCGFPVPASEISEMGIFDKIFIDIGDEQSIENDLSTYSSHLVNMKFFMKHADERTLVLIDEFGSGTEPAVGGAIAEAVLADLLKKQTFGLITTHYANLKIFASSNEGIINGAMLFDTHLIRPLFKLETGIPGSSFAFEIARNAGIPEHIVREARNRLGDKHADMEKSLREIAGHKRYIEEKKDRIRKTDKHLDQLSDKYEKELLELREARKKIIAEAKNEARRILATVNREIENTIRTIKESQAEKEQTKLVRSNIDRLKTEIDSTGDETGEIEREVEKVRKRREHKQNRTQQPHSNPPDSAAPVAPVEETPALMPGDRVRIKGQNATGEVISAGANNIAIAVGHMIVNLTPDRVERISRNEYRQIVRNSVYIPSHTADFSVKRLNFKPMIDLRGQRTTDALETVIAFIDEAIVLEMNEVRILHGKGNGILKEEIRRYLKTFGNLLRFTDESEEAGGAGITVVRFS
jgi:DNA mismatch repair protein MutS2